jgi:hypothetical protein
MPTPFTYSILQYRHSLVLGEAINVGILFQFPDEEKFEFVSGNAYRLKAIYPDFDQSVYNYLIKSIEKKLKQDNSDLFKFSNSKSNLKEYIHTSLLSEDASVLQFREPIKVLSNKDNFGQDDRIEKIVDEFSKLLLPKSLK